MSYILHVLNGDATLSGFEMSGLEGDILVWREVLSEGPISADVSAASFWMYRREWICSTYNESPERYDQGITTHLEMLSRPYREVNLWFEFDLHCQVNLLAIMALLSKQADLNERSIYVISPAAYPGNEDFMGMGELDGDELAYLYDNIRLQLNEYDFKVAKEAWELYSSGNKDRLAQWLDETSFWGSLHLLKPALQAHLKRLESDAGGLNYIHHKLLAIYNRGIQNRVEIYKAFWRDEKIYGMGDSQIDTYLSDLIAKGLISF